MSEFMSISFKQNNGELLRDRTTNYTPPNSLIFKKHLPCKNLEQQALHTILIWILIPVELADIVVLELLIKGLQEHEASKYLAIFLCYRHLKCRERVKVLPLYDNPFPSYRISV